MSSNFGNNQINMMNNHHGGQWMSSNNSKGGGKWFGNNNENNNYHHNNQQHHHNNFPMHQHNNNFHHQKKNFEGVRHPVRVASDDEGNNNSFGNRTPSGSPNQLRKHSSIREMLQEARRDSDGGSSSPPPMKRQRILSFTETCVRGETQALNNGKSIVVPQELLADSRVTRSSTGNLYLAL